MALEQSRDWGTAKAFSKSWLHAGSISSYTPEQAEDWFQPLTQADAVGGQVTELGCGNGSLLLHMAQWQPQSLTGIELGASIDAARRNLDHAGLKQISLHQADLVTYRGVPQDLTYCIGVLHHLKRPVDGFDSVLENTRPGGRFHCWVYAHEGNALVRLVVEPTRKLCSRMPWWFSKHIVATTLVAPYFVYAKLVARLPHRWAQALPLGLYSQWIAKRGFGFFRHVAFDQIVTPQTAYIRREEVAAWLANARIEPASTYIIMRNGNSWKFGGRRRGTQ